MIAVGIDWPLSKGCSGLRQFQISVESLLGFSTLGQTNLRSRAWISTHRRLLYRETSGTHVTTLKNFLLKVHLYISTGWWTDWHTQTIIKTHTYVLLHKTGKYISVYKLEIVSNAVAGACKLLWVILTSVSSGTPSILDAASECANQKLIMNYE